MFLEIGQFLKRLSPTFIRKVYKRMFPAKMVDGLPAISTVLTWSGNYVSWSVALAQTSGYNDGAILQKCKSALLKVKSGEAVYERDGVLFDKVEYSWPLLTALLNCAIENSNQLKVLDFGGSLGSTYFQNKPFLSTHINSSWHIVEQPLFVEEGKAFFEDEVLKFFFTIKESLQSRPANIFILSGVLQYLPEPHQFIREILSYQFPYIILDRTGFEKLHGKDVLTIQQVPESIYTASYPCWFFNEDNLLDLFRSDYEIQAVAADSFTVDVITNDNYFYWKFFLLKLKDAR